MHQESNKNQQHEPVLLGAVLRYLDPKAGERYLDLTAGYGGHAAAIIERTHSPATLVDRDLHAIDVLRERFDGRVALEHTDFLQASRKLVEAGERFDMILADLGVSSPHLNEAYRGFSFLAEAPLDMRMDRRQDLTAATIANTWTEPQLVRLLTEYGEEPKAVQIARLIVANRPLVTTTELAAVVAKAWPGHSRVHPATRTFQAIRIAVNDELGLLEGSLPLWHTLLTPGGRLGIISFHSLEDRLVKRYFAEHAGDRYDTDLQLLTKRPITAGPDEIVFNPRARSAKLRVAVKIKNQKERG